MENKEKYLINQIVSHRETVYTDELWTAISGSIPQEKEKKRRGIIWFISGFLLLLITFSIGYQLIGNPMNIEVQNETSNEIIVLEEKQTGNKDLISNTETASIENETIQEVINSELLFNDVRTKKILDFGEAKHTVNGQNFRNEIWNEDQNMDFISSSNLNGYSAIEEERKDDASPLVDESRNDQNTKPFTQIETNDFTDFDELAFVPSINLNSLNFQRDKIKIEAQDFVKVDLSLEKSTKMKRWSAFMNTEFSYVTRQLETNDSEFRDQVERRESTEKILGGWNFASGIFYRINPVVSIGSGLSIGKIYEQASFSTSYQIESQEESVIEIIHTQDGAINSVSGNVVQYSNRQTNEIRNNSFRYFSIPAIIKTRILENENYRLDFSGNIAYSFSQKYDGFISYDENLPSYDLEQDIQNNFTRSGGLSYGFGIEATRKIYRNWELNFGVSMKSLTNITTDINPISQNYKLYNLTFGISRNL